jgi:hypothetical protein
MQSDFGNDPGISTQNKAYTRILHRTHFAHFWLDQCDGDKQRKYFYINENSLEWNYPMSCAIWLPGIPFVTGQNILGCFECCALPPNCCCPGFDTVTKVYFDRGMFDRQSCWWRMGFCSGEPQMFPNEVKRVFLCIECCDWFDELTACYFPALCGERVRYVPCTTCCCCCPTESTPLTNFCGLFGSATGEPNECCLMSVRTGLAPGEAEMFVAAFDVAHKDWMDYTAVNADTL